jgi:hypothetical protein
MTSMIVLLIFLLAANAIKVSFYSANIESQTLSEDELKAGLAVVDPSNESDIVVISLQETSTRMANLNLNLNGMDCSTQYKTGFTKFPSLYALVSRICFKKGKFTVFEEENPAGFGTRLKGGVGNCLKPTSGEADILCFLALHLDTEPGSEGALRLLDLVSNLYERITKKDSTVRDNIIFYGIGDWNLRLYPSYPVPKTVNEMQSLLDDQKTKNNAKFIEGNAKIEELFKTCYSKISSQSSKAFKVDFLKNNLVSLPLTYKYNTPKKTPIPANDFNLQAMITTKSSGFELEPELNNFGWLDRLGCLYADDTHKCRVKGNEVQYFEVSALRKGDHLPIAGKFVIQN